MGQTKSPKEEDKPQTKLQRDGGELSGGSEGDQEPDCPPTFSVRLSKAAAPSEGTPLSLRKTETGLSIVANGEGLKLLPDKKQKKITPCLKKGFRYVGEVVNKNSTVYGEFVRRQ